MKEYRLKECQIEWRSPHRLKKEGIALLATLRSRAAKPVQLSLMDDGEDKVVIICFINGMIELVRFPPNT
jgi:hypothetical protein